MFIRIRKFWQEEFTLTLPSNFLFILFHEQNLKLICTYIFYKAKILHIRLFLSLIILVRAIYSDMHIMQIASVSLTLEKRWIKTDFWLRWITKLIKLWRNYLLTLYGLAEPNCWVWEFFNLKIRRDYKKILWERHLWVCRR